MWSSLLENPFDFELVYRSKSGSVDKFRLVFAYDEAMGTSFFSQGAVKRVQWHDVYMHFMLRQGWSIQFLESDLRTSIPRKLTFADPSKIVEMQQRWGVDTSDDASRELLRDIEKGRGSAWLRLTQEQYDKLTKK